MGSTATTPFVPMMIPQFAPEWAEIFGEDDYGIFAEFTLKKARFVWRWIMPGRFLMGSPPDEAGRLDDEGPQHSVTISRGFWLGETPVTQEQWTAVMGDNPSKFKGEQRPVEQVNWHHSAAYASKLSDAVLGLKASLPAESQWEYACRAGTRGAFHVAGSVCTQPTGRDPVLDQLGWFNGNSKERTEEVKRKSRNNWGLYDMHGNVWEWCLDGKRTYEGQPEPDPMAPRGESARRVVRGGSWRSLAVVCRAAFRRSVGPSDDWVDLGLRLLAGQ